MLMVDERLFHCLIFVYAAGIVFSLTYHYGQSKVGKERGVMTFRKIVVKI